MIHGVNPRLAVEPARRANRDKAEAAGGCAPVAIPIDQLALEGTLVVPDGANGIVVFAHGSGSSRRSPRNQIVARRLQTAGFGTLLFDLLTADEERRDAATGQWRFNIPLLAERLVVAARWLAEQPVAARCGLGFFGASTGAAAAIVAAAMLGPVVRAVVSRGGRPDLAGPALPLLRAPTLLIVGSGDPEVLELNRSAGSRLTCLHRLEVVPHATHLFEEPGALAAVAELAADWFRRHLRAAGTKPGR
jgi:dienelactone hydrolase